MSQSPWRLTSIVAAAGAGVALACAVFHPGVMSPDSLGMYSEAIDGSISGMGQSPVMAWFWMWILRVHAGPFGLLLFQNMLFWTGLALVAAARRGGGAWPALSILFIGLFPTVFALIGILWKDVLLAGSLTCAVGLTLLGAKRRSRALLAAASVPLLGGLCFRVNALPAVVPLAVWLVAVWAAVGGRRHDWRGLMLGSVLLSFGLFGLSRLADRAVLPPGTGAAMNAFKESMLHDLAAIGVMSGDLRMPPYVLRGAPGMTLDNVRSAYDTADDNRFFYNPHWSNSALITRSREDLVELVRTWAGAVSAHPGVYLHHRWDVVLSIYQVRGVYYPFHTGIDPNSLGLEFTTRPLYVSVTSWLYATRQIFFRGWVFGVVSLAIVGIGARRGRWSAVAVSASGLLYASSYMVITSGSDFRYIWWLIVSTLLASTVVLSDYDEALPHSRDHAA
jgi:hypothetical protein